MTSQILIDIRVEHRALWFTIYRIETIDNSRPAGLLHLFNTEITVLDTKQKIVCQSIGLDCSLKLVVGKGRY